MRPNNEKLAFLRDVIEVHGQEFLPLLDKLGQTPLTQRERESLRGVVADELVRTGLRSNSEPNDRGLLLEELIDWLGHF